MILDKLIDSSLNDEFNFFVSNILMRAKFFGNDFNYFTVSFIWAPSSGHSIRKGWPLSAYLYEIFLVIMLEIQSSQYVCPHIVKILGRLLSLYYWLQMEQKTYDWGTIIIWLNFCYFIYCFQSILTVLFLWLKTNKYFSK